MRRYEITIPQSNIGQLRHSDFQWTFTVYEDLVNECRAQYSSSELYKEFTKIQVDDVLYESVIFDFIQGKLILETNERERNKVLRILKYFTVKISPTSRMIFLNSKKSDGVL
ncbi:hypothetical protein [Ureibacillus acetophenoni]|uniref:Uncharacterized protein n=1 Tax=Ureibacillus acetophenoni TaxID=614649 RepID=A0A285TZ59_9BACL|nr:hypothetical protein [Ureibacillus acetophenoni]SOC34763.1 hypothetical protein SAMN05877842_10199 [Ureibacillus acetophenoni]